MTWRVFMDAVVAPARDGGYVMLGVSRPADALLARIPWGTRHVLAATLGRLANLHWRYRVLRWQHDVDRPADLRRALQELDRPTGIGAAALTCDVASVA